MRQVLTCVMVLAGWQLGIGTSEAAPRRADATLNVQDQMVQLSHIAAQEPSLLAHRYRHPRHCGPSYYGRRHHGGYGGYGYGYGYGYPRRTHYRGYGGHYNPHYYGSGVSLHFGF